MKRAERLLAILALVALVVAYSIPILFPKGVDYLSKLEASFPEAEELRQVSQDPPIFQAFATEDGERRLLGYVGLGSAVGYEGPILSAVVSDPQGNILRVTVLDNTEWLTWLRKVDQAGYVKGFAGRRVDDALTLGADIDAVSSATFTSRGIADGVRQAAHAIARTQLGLPVKSVEQKLVFDLKAILALALWAVAIAGVILKQSKLRWVTMLASLGGLGFWLAAPLSFSSFAALLLGRVPPLDTAHLVWYLLFGGVIATVLVFGRNLYCYWICPFGALHELLTVASGGGLTPSPTVGRLLRRARPVLVWGALIFIFLTRSPSTGSYEPFGTFFTRTGSGLSWALLILVLVMGLVSKRFWCLYFCPVGYTVDFLASWRRRLAKLFLGWPRKEGALAAMDASDEAEAGD